MEQHSNLYIPVNIKTRFEFFSGFGFAELVPTVIVALLSGVAAFIVHDDYYAYTKIVGEYVGRTGALKQTNSM
jgi:hypothetical protein